MYIIFLSVLQKAQSDYEEKLKALSAMFSLTWDIDELSKLSSEGRDSHVAIATALDALKRPEPEYRQLNIPRKVS